MSLKTTQKSGHLKVQHTIRERVHSCLWLSEGGPTERMTNMDKDVDLRRQRMNQNSQGTTEQKQKTETGNVRDMP